MVVVFDISFMILQKKSGFIPHHRLRCLAKVLCFAVRCLAVHGSSSKLNRDLLSTVLTRDAGDQWCLGDLAFDAEF
jgi:hypothetical protein